MTEQEAKQRLIEIEPSFITYSENLQELAATAFAMGYNQGMSEGMTRGMNSLANLQNEVNKIFHNNPTVPAPSL